MTYVIFRLDCGHLTYGDARSSVFTCHQGLDGSHKGIVIDVVVKEWRSKCLSCKFSRWTGSSRELAQIHTRRHGMKHKLCVTLHEVNPQAERVRKQLVKIGVIQNGPKVKRASND